MSQREYDEKDWGLEIERCDDGDLLLRQGDCCGCGDDVAVRLHPCHFPLMAGYIGLMTREQFDNATTKANDRLHMLAGLISAHLPVEHPLVKSAALMMGQGCEQRQQREPNSGASEGATADTEQFALRPTNSPVPSKQPGEMS